MRRLYSCWFTAERNDYYKRMACILKRTAEQHCAGWDVHVEEFPGSRADSGTTAANTKKLDWWTDRVSESENGDEILLIDADCVITRPLDDAWGMGFDVAITRRGEVCYPYNAGVVFVRVSERSRLFMQTWQAVNHKLRGNPKEHSKWRTLYGGMNQAALGALLEAGLAAPLDLKIAELPCAEWNCEDSTWREYDSERTRIVHYKSGLRIAALAIGASKPEYSELVKMWRRLDREVNGCAS